MLARLRKEQNIYKRYSKRGTKMFSNRYEREQLALEQHYQLLLDLEKHRLRREKRQQQPSKVQYLTGRLVVLLVKLRKNLKTVG